MVRHLAVVIEDGLLSDPVERRHANTVRPRRAPVNRALVSPAIVLALDGGVDLLTAGILEGSGLDYEVGPGYVLILARRTPEQADVFRTGPWTSIPQPSKEEAKKGSAP